VIDIARRGPGARRLLGDGEVAGGADREELGESFDDAENNGLEVGEFDGHEPTA